MASQVLRHLYDAILSSCYKSLEVGILNKFIRSRHYDYILNLKLKQSRVVGLDYFRVLGVRGKGAFGHVLEVTKRDCGKRYAMKVMSKGHLIERFGELWEAVAMVERAVMGKLHHPLLINLAYAFQNVDYLVLVVDLCEGGDLTIFGAGGPEKLTAEQVRFCGMEVLAMLLHLQRSLIMHRDIKPDNLLLDAEGHVRLIDFGTAKAHASRRPTSREECGTRAYMAPEVYFAEERDTAYDYRCDLYSFGVLLYELSEKEYPCAHDCAWQPAPHDRCALPKPGMKVPLPPALSGALPSPVPSSPSRPCAAVLLAARRVRRTRAPRGGWRGGTAPLQHAATHGCNDSHSR